ncbi:hypothetical protein LIER_27523 [Lithospermum erythrorhizon]|uniref:Uncharacterized protein n=1 Tax=Lithospermum erythrorhizon TaxID=34254 RepID=A0AAV3RCF6_LITER
MSPNGNNNNPHGSDALNLNNLAARHPEKAPPNVQVPINIGSEEHCMGGGGESSHPYEMGGLIQGLTEKIVDSVMEQLRERLPHLRGETPAVSSFIREDREETYTHTPPVRMNNEPLTGQ